MDRSRKAMPVEWRFWDKVRIGPGCWEWMASRINTGYGQFLVEPKKSMKLAHRVAFELLVGPIPAGMEIDHTCHNRGCVNPAHLRIASRPENQHNQRLHRNNTSGIKGVSWHKKMKKWRADIAVNGQSIHLGNFIDIEDAKQAHIEAATKHHGEFANHGEPNQPPTPDMVPGSAKGLGVQGPTT